MEAALWLTKALSTVAPKQTKSSDDSRKNTVLVPLGAVVHHHMAVSHLHTNLIEEVKEPRSGGLYRYYLEVTEPSFPWLYELS